MPLMALAEKGSREFHSVVKVNLARFHWDYSTSLLPTEHFDRRDFQKFSSREADSGNGSAGTQCRAGQQTDC